MAFPILGLSGMRPGKNLFGISVELVEGVGDALVAHVSRLVAKAGTVLVVWIRNTDEHVRIKAG